MGRLLLLALGAALFPALLACVALLLSRPHPRRLLLAFYLGGVLISVASGIAILALLHSGAIDLSSRPSSHEPGAALLQGALALLLAYLMVTRRAQRWTAGRRRRRRPPDEDKPSRVERALSHASAKLAFAVGMVINLPGPFYLVALADIANGDYSPAGQLALILAFNAIMFLLAEVPLVGYLVRPQNTAQLVERLSRWLNANGLRLAGLLVGAFGCAQVAQGLAALA